MKKTQAQCEIEQALTNAEDAVAKADEVMTRKVPNKVYVMIDRKGFPDGVTKLRDEADEWRIDGGYVREYILAPRPQLPGRRKQRP